MGWLDKAKAAADEARRKSKELAGAAREKAESELGDKDWYGSLKEKAQDAASVASDLASGAKEFAGEAMGEIGATDLGQRVGGYTRSFTSRLAALPVFTLSGDVMKVRHGIEPLYEHLREDKQDPMRHVWLAEAMGRVKQDGKTYSRIRSVADPTFFVVGQAVRAANALGAEEKDATELRLLKNAFALSGGRLRVERRDPVALHALARVYRAQGDAAEAIRFSKMAYVADTSSPLPMVTLAQTYLAIGQHQNAQRAAEIAIEAGAGYGRTVLADLVLLDETSEPKKRIEDYSQYRDAVSTTDREAYLGPCVQGVSVLEGVGRTQLERFTSLFS